MNNLKICLLFTLSINILSYSQVISEDEVTNYAINNIEEFVEFLSYPNDANNKEDIEKLIDWTSNRFNKLGFDTKRLQTESVPLLLAELVYKKSYNTILIYLHLDGQPVDNSKWYQENPYKPVLKAPGINGEFVIIDWENLNNKTLNKLKNEDIRIFARSASDAKGPVMMLINALEIININNLSPKFNIKLIMDFEEEKSSPSLPSTVVKYSDDLKSDGLLIFDGPQHSSGLPTLNFGNRGISQITLTTYGPIVPQHSGHFGNYAPNPVFRMSNILSSMKDENGLVLIDGYYDGINMTAEILDDLNRVPDDEKKMLSEMQFKSPEKVGRSYQEALQYPSLNVRGIESGWVKDEARTIIPSECIAEIDVRLVLESDGYRLHQLVRKHIESLGYKVLDRRPTKEERLNYDKIVTFDSKVSYPAFRTDINSDLGKWLSKSLTKTFGKTPVKKRTSGGSVPISPFVSILNIPAVGVPTVNKDNNQHSPNENIKVSNYINGIRTFIGILNENY
tara:strand:- start:474 stop:1997 length:1524 start_codon:yes stop_codon:yes gene_type:complete